MNGKIYVGSSKAVDRRKACHFWRLRTGTHHSLHLQASYNKHGADAFTFEIIEEAPENMLIEREQYFIDLLSPAYNIAKIAGSNIGTKRTPEQLVKQALANTGKVRTKEHKRRYSESKMGDKNPCYGKVYTEDERAMMAEKMRGKKFPFKEQPLLKKQVEQYSMSGEFVAEYASLTAAAKAVGGVISGISGHLSGNGQSYKGFTYKFKQR